MGCGSSAGTAAVLQTGEGTPRKKSILPQQIPKISIVGLENVSFVPSPEMKVMFIFGEHQSIVHNSSCFAGGPGSGKGRIVAKLCERFNIRLLSVESLILKHLPKKVKRVLSLNTIKEMSDVVRRDPSLISLDWVLKLLHHTMTETSANNTREVIYLVDMIPNLKWLVRNEYLVKNCSREMEIFEDKVRTEELHAICVTSFVGENIVCCKPSGSGEHVRGYTGLQLPTHSVQHLCCHIRRSRQQQSQGSHKDGHHHYALHYIASL